VDGQVAALDSPRSLRLAYGSSSNCTIAPRMAIWDLPAGQEHAPLGIDLSLPSDQLELPAGQALTRVQETAVKQRRGLSVSRALERLMADPRHARLNDAGRVNAVERPVSRHDLRRAPHSVATRVAQ
jgi:hypothetical protein